MVQLPFIKERVRKIALSSLDTQLLTSLKHTSITIETSLHTASVVFFGSAIITRRYDLSPSEKPSITLEIDWESKSIHISYDERSPQ